MGKPSYYELVYELAKLIPTGRVTTYGAMADYLCLGSARMVGWALHQSMGTDEVPAHRVVNRLGELSGRVHFRPPSLMQERLEQEGIQVQDHRIVNFEAHFWSPKLLDEEDF